MIHGTGWIADPKGVAMTSARRLIGSGPAPASSDLTPWVPGTRNQHASSACVGFSLTSAVYTAFSAAGRPVPLPSGAWAYKVGLCVDRVYNGVGMPAPLRDEGSMPNQVKRGVEEFGLVNESDYPLDMATVMSEPTLAELELASVQHVIGWRRIDSYGPGRVDDIKRALGARIPVCFAVEVDRAFEDHTGSGVLGPLKGASKGGHMIYLCGHETLASGITVVRLQNSWGRGWGDKGFALCDESFIARMSDLYVPSTNLVGG